MERLTCIGKYPIYGASEIKESRLGIGFEKLDRNVFDPEKAYGKLERIGVKRVRIQSGWARTETSRGVYDFAWLDAIVDNLLARGLSPWICLCYGNPLYTELAVPVFGAVGCPPIASEEEMAAWLAYVRATVAHFRGRVSLYEIWNEPDTRYSWKHAEGGEPDFVRNATEYGVFASATAIAVKETDREARVIGLAAAGVKNMHYLNTALATGLYRHIDYVSFHVYSPDERKRLASIRRLRALVDRYDPRIGLIQGEGGAQSRSDGHGAMMGFAWTPERQTKCLLRGLITDLGEDLAFTSYFSTMDMIEGLTGKIADKRSYLDYGYFGVIGAEFDENGRASGEYREKPSYYALQTLAALMRENAHPITIPFALEALPSLRVNGTDCADETVTVYGFSLCDGSRALIYWKATELLTSTYEGTVTLSVYGENTESIRLLDLADGSLYTIPENMIEDLGKGGVRLLHLPLTDSPLAILF